MIKLFTGWLNKNEDDSELKGHSHLDRVLLETKKIMSFDSGKLFRGHGGGLIVEGKKLKLYNSYYTNHVCQIYNTENDLITREYMMDSNGHPKYIQSILDNAKYDDYKFTVGDIEIYLYCNSIRIIKTVTEKGLEFRDHWDNINELKSLRYYMKKFKNIIKTEPNILSMGKKDKNGLAIVEKLVI
tara:strand:+ start:313 stop:867 length:555 start_codon:yes stop_codon:yes gene_type:complete